jgi:PmbA protein
VTDLEREARNALGAMALEEAARAGAAAADVFVKDSTGSEAAAPTRATGWSVERGIALRFFDREGRSSLAASTLPGAAERAPGGPAIASTLSRRAATAAALAAPAPAPALPPAWSADGRGLGLFDPDLETDPEDLLESAEEIRAHASDAAPGCDVHVRLHATTSMVHFANTAGFEGGYRQTLARLDLTLSARRDGAAAAARVVRAARSLRGLAADSAVAEALDLVEESLAQKLSPSGIHEIVLAPRAAAELVAAISAWVTGPGASAGDRIGAGPLTVLDDGRLPGGVASAPFDGEGTRTGRTVVVERGVVRELLRDLQRGGAEGSTGNGVRASFREAPRLRPSNFFIKPGALSPSNLLGSVRQGIRISTLGRLPRLASPESPFAVPFTGRWIENGRLGAPLGGGYLAGTVREILGEITEVASDLAFFQRGGSFGAPSLLVSRAPIRSS